ncbi:phosphatidylinositol-specific phospholipase C/glycerophosphodiester phosphodiesterase family protein [Cohnella abietis]|uniref:GP-PDE domain-containing protein n=1 Tax=Cohnella abietis TaxID=2507935 RepID=A0A3T1D3Z1_9BACL|nr:phosphatidylinositol-specific phospholipase C/glycerophosphodiester phosphodiesterase family protein [Cohnella abietis]BBI32823.1 hypothetical protein KCTCHS21_22220 [Cohnella abietis]
MNKKIVCLSLLIVVCMIWLGWGFIWSMGDKQAPANHTSAWEKNEFIAHALGGIDGASKTNSYEAFIANYDRGYRLFEVDLLETADGEFVARHDWSPRLQPDMLNKTSHTLTMSQFKSSPILGKFHPLSLIDILQLMQQYPDFHLIIDTKETSKEKIQQQFEFIVKQATLIDSSLLERIIPEIYNPDMYDVIMKVYPFPNKIYSLYKSGASAASIIDFVKDKQFSVVAMPAYRVFLNPNLVHSLNKLGIKSYVHTINDKPQMKLLQSFGVHGFYTDLEISPDKLALKVAKTNNVSFWNTFSLHGLV